MLMLSSCTLFSTACNIINFCSEDLLNEAQTVGLIMLKHSVLFKYSDTVTHTQEEYSHQFNFCSVRNILQLMFKWCKKGLNHGKRKLSLQRKGIKFCSEY
jgi:hypothetical protein